MLRGRDCMLPRHSTGYSECSAIGWMTLLGNIPTRLNIKKEHININETEQNKRNKDSNTLGKSTLKNASLD